LECGGLFRRFLSFLLSFPHLLRFASAFFGVRRSIPPLFCFSFLINKSKLPRNTLAHVVSKRDQAMSDALRLRLIDQIMKLPNARLAEVERLLSENSSAPVRNIEQPPRDWPHAPLHRLSDQGTYMVTAATLDQQHYFRGDDRLSHLETELLALAKQMCWQLEAWAVFSNHYHFVGHALVGAQPLSELIAELHRRTAVFVNALDAAAGRQVWFNYWDTELTFEKSYLARLNYVHQNAVKHGLVQVANQYRWCSAGWFERTASPAQVRTIYSFKTDRLKLEDEFQPV